MSGRSEPLGIPEDSAPPPGRIRPRLPIAAIVAIAALIRLAFILTLGRQYYFADTAEYRAAALTILHGTAPGPTTPRAPVFPAFLALGYRLGGLDNFLLLRLMQLALALATVAVAAWIGRRVGRVSTGLLTALGVALSPTLVFSTGLLYPTTLYTLILLALTAGALRLAKQPGLLLAAGLGVLLGFGMLTDEVMVAPGAAIFGWLLAQSRRAGRAVAVAAIALALTAGAINVAYVCTQATTADGQVPFVGKAQWTLWYARTDSTMAPDRLIHNAPHTPFVALSAGQFLAHEWRLFSTRPLAYARDYVYELAHFFWPGVDRLQTVNRFTHPAILAIGAVHFWPVLIFAIIGLLAGRAAGRDRLLLTLVIMATAAFYSLFFTQTRYRIPVEPQFTLLAALGLERVFPRFADWLEGARRER